MTTKEVKLALAKKYERLVKAASSKVKKKAFRHKVRTYRNQVKELSRE